MRGDERKVMRALKELGRTAIFLLEDEEQVHRSGFRQGVLGTKEPENLLEALSGSFHLRDNSALYRKGPKEKKKRERKE